MHATSQTRRLPDLAAKQACTARSGACRSRGMLRALLSPVRVAVSSTRARRDCGVRGVQLIYSSTCATYGNPEVLPVTEETAAVPINPYGRAKLMAEGAIRDYAAANPALRAVIFRYFNVYGSDPGGALGEFPPPSLRQHSRISGACMDAALQEITSLKITGADLFLNTTLLARNGFRWLRTHDTYHHT